MADIRRGQVETVTSSKSSPWAGPESGYLVSDHPAAIAAMVYCVFKLG